MLLPIVTVTFSMTASLLIQQTLEGTNALNSFPDTPCLPMFAIYAYIGVVLGVNVGICGIHGVFGICIFEVWFCLGHYVICIVPINPVLGGCFSCFLMQAQDIQS